MRWIFKYFKDRDTQIKDVEYIERLTYCWIVHVDSEWSISIENPAPTPLVHSRIVKRSSFATWQTTD